MPPVTRYRFGAFQCDTRERLLFRQPSNPGGLPADHVLVPLTPKAIDTLLVLLERSGRLVSRDEMMRAVWPDTYVEEGSLTRNISALRKALDDVSETPAYIETVPRRGYRFVAPVEAEVTQDEDGEHVEAAASPEAGVEIAFPPLGEDASDLVAPSDLAGGPAGLAMARGEASAVATVPVSAAVATGPVSTALTPADVSATVGTPAAPPVPDTGTVRRSPSRPLLVGAVVLGACVLVAIGVVWTRSSVAVTPHPALGAIKTVAVLPFSSLGATNDNAHLATGVADAVITRLAKGGLVGVRPTRMILSLGDRRDIQAIGQQLGVDAVVDGTLQRIDGRIRVSVQVVSVKSGTPVWADTFDDRAADAFEIEDVISERIARAWSGRRSEEQPIARRRASNPEAYERYLRGRYFWSKRTEDALRSAITWFNRAIESDPNNAMAYAGLADSWALLGWSGGMSMTEAVGRAKAAATHALALDATLPEPHAALGLASCLQWEWGEAEREFRKAIELDAENATARQMYAAMFLIPLGRGEEGIAQLQRAQALDPLSLTIRSNLGAAYYYARLYERAVDEHRRVLEVDPAFASAHYGMALAFEQLGQNDRAIAELEGLTKAGTLQVGALTALGHAYGIAGRRGDAQRVLRDLETLVRRGLASPYMLALVQLGLDDRAPALASLERAAADRSVWLPWCRVDPRFDALRTDQRFQALLVHLTPQAAR